MTPFPRSADRPPEQQQGHFADAIDAVEYAYTRVILAPYQSDVEAEAKEAYVTVRRALEQRYSELEERLGAALRDTAHVEAYWKGLAVRTQSALENWGRHFTWCAIHRELGRGAPPPICDCGLSAALGVAGFAPSRPAPEGERP